MTWAGASVRSKKTQTRSPGTRAASLSFRRCQPSVRSPRALLAQSPVPRVSGAFLDVWGQLGESRGGGTAREEQGRGGGSRPAPRPSVPRTPSRRRGQLPRVGLSAPGAGRWRSSPVPLPSFGRPPGLSKPGGESLQGFPESSGKEEGTGTGAGSKDPEPARRRPGAAPPAPPAPPHARSLPAPAPGGPRPLPSRRESGPGGRG